MQQREGGDHFEKPVDKEGVGGSCDDVVLTHTFCTKVDFLSATINMGPTLYILFLLVMIKLDNLETKDDNMTNTKKVNAL